MIGHKDMFKLVVDTIQPMPNKSTLGNRNHLDGFAKPKTKIFTSNPSSASNLSVHLHRRLLSCLRVLASKPYIVSTSPSLSFLFACMSLSLSFTFPRLSSCLTLKILLVDFSLKFQMVAIHRLVDIQRQRYYVDE